MQLYWMYSSIVRLGGWFIVYFTKQHLEKEYDNFVIKKEQSLNVIKSLQCVSSTFKTEHDFHKPIYWTSQFLYVNRWGSNREIRLI